MSWPCHDYRRGNDKTTRPRFRLEGGRQEFNTETPKRNGGQVRVFEAKKTKRQGKGEKQFKEKSCSGRTGGAEIRGGLTKSRHEPPPDIGGRIKSGRNPE